MAKARIGQLTERITFQSETTAADGRGGVTSTGWANIATTPEVWASCTVQDGSEGQRGDMVTNEYTVAVFIRNRNDIMETMRVVWRGLNYDIVSIQPYQYGVEFRALKINHGAPGQGT